MMIDVHGLMRLSDGELVTRTRGLVATSVEVEADLLVHLGEIDRRKLYLEHACASMFTFCTNVLGFSEDATYNRIFVARAARSWPALIDALRNGRVHLSGLRLLAPHLTKDNHVELLDAATGKSKREIEEQVARIAPKPAVPTLIRKLPEPQPPRLLAQADAARPAPSLAVSLLAPAPEARPPLTPPVPTPPMPAPSRTEPRPTIQPLSEASYKVQFTATRELKDKLREAQDLLRHQVPDGDLAKVLERAVDLLIEKVKKERFGAGRKSKTKPESSDETKRARPTRSRHIPAAIRRAVHERDGERCTFVDAHGHRCKETGGLEFDHVDGYARTGVHSVAGIRLMCSAHNAHAADRMYGRSFMEQARASQARTSSNGTSKRGTEQALTCPGTSRRRLRNLG